MLVFQRPDVGSGLLVALATFVVLLAWRTARRARRAAADRAKIERERQPEHRARLAARLGCSEADLPELGEWKITPDFACLLADLVDEASPRRVLELGSGSSTLVLASLLAPTGARLASLEEDGQHVEATRRRVRDRGFGDIVTLEHAPIERAGSTGDDDPPWYAQSALERLKGEAGPPWDLVIVDGPSTVRRADARLPALPRLAGLLSPRAIVVLDDAGRPGERAVVAAWREMGLLRDFDVEEIPLARGAVVLRRRG